MKKLRKRTWGETLAADRKKTNNDPAAHKAKLQVRRNVLEAIGAGNASVLDLFAGDGAMWRGVWREAAVYVGCDQDWFRDERLAYVTDNRRLLRAVDLSAFNIFDLDAWGSPWEQAIVLAARRHVKPAERIGVVLTEGAGFRINLGTIPDGLAIMAKMNTKAAGGSRSLTEISDRAIYELAHRLGCRIIDRWRAQGTSGARMIYSGIVLEGIA